MKTPQPVLPYLGKLHMSAGTEFVSFLWSLFGWTERLWQKGLRSCKNIDMNISFWTQKNWIDWVIIGVTLVEEFFKSRVKNQKSILEKYVFDMYLISWCLIFYFYGSIFLVFWKLLISVTYCLIIAVSIGYSSMNFKLKTYKFHNIFRSCHHTV